MDGEEADARLCNRRLFCEQNTMVGERPRRTITGYLIAPRMLPGRAVIEAEAATFFQLEVMGASQG